MKIAIQGHPFRGYEVIQILESLGGKNVEGLTGTYETFYYIDDKNEIGDDHKKNFPSTYKLYTLEEFEKEFPFKVGDKVRDCSDDEIGTILGFIDLSVFINVCNELMYVVDFEKSGHANMPVKKLKPYKEMKEERNITLTLEKAKEWYKKGGELREIALQAFTEKELTKVELPKTWKEFCDNYPVQKGECWLGGQDRIFNCVVSDGGLYRQYKNWISSQKSAEAHLAMIQLEQLRDCWRQGWKPTDYDTGYCITHYPEGYSILSFNFISFLSFSTKKMAEEFLECFRDLIEKAGDLI